MKKLGIALGGIAAVLFIATVLASYFISSDDILNTVTENVEGNTGRVLRVNGEAQFSVFPSLVVELNDVTFSNAEHATEPHMASMSMLSLHFPWTSIFTGNVVIDKFVIDELNLTLEKSRHGEVNWQIGPPGDNVSTATPADNNGDAGEVTRTKFPDSFDVSLGEVEINSGTFTYLDHQQDSIERVSDLSLAIILPSLRKPLQMDGSLTYKNQTFAIQTTLDNPIKLINGEVFTTNFTVDSQLVKLQYDGDVQQTPLAVTGKLSVTGDSVKEILAWQDVPLEAKENAFNQFSLAASIGLTEQQFVLEALNLQLDALNIEGQSTIKMNATPTITAVINLGDLDVNPYLPTTTEPPPPPPEEKTPIQWDETEMDLSGLSAVNVDIQVVSDSLTFQEIKLGKNQLSLRLTNGLMTLGLDEFNAYAGSGTGKLSLDSAQKPYQIATRFNLQGIDFQPLLSDAVGFDKLMGSGKVNWQLQTSGLSQKDFVSALAGVMAFDVQDGAVRGANIAAIAESAQNILTGNIAAVSLDQNFSNAEKTDFASLKGNMNFKNGVMNTDDILLLNPFVRVSVTGSVDLPATSTNLRASTKLVSSGQGQGGDVDASGINIPVKITGPFHDVKIRPDTESLMKDKLEDTLKDKLGDKLKGLFGG